MNQIKHLGFLLLAGVSLLASCTPTKPGEGGGDEKKVVLSADKKEITADGEDKVVFTVKYDNNDVTAEAVIVEVASAQAVKEHAFSTDKAGTYTFKATYDGKESEEVTVTANAETGLKLSVDKESIINNGEDQATFTVTYLGEDVTKTASIVSVTEGKPWKPGENVFSSATSGVYEFKAGYNDMVSNTVTVNVTVAPLKALILKSDTPRIAANGTDKATFTVLYNGQDVTSEAKIKDLSSDQYLESNVFTYSGSANKVDFVAEYAGETSDRINIGFGDFYKNVLLCRFTGTWCAPCTSLGEALSAALESYPDRLHQIAVHVNDQFTSFQYSVFGNYFTGSTVPRTYYDMQIEDAFAASDIVNVIKKYQAKGAACGIAISSVMDGRTAHVTVKVTAAVPEKYYLGVVLVEDGLVGPQTGTTSYVHDNTMRNIATSLGGDILGILEENKEVEETYTFDLSDYTDNCRIIAYVNTQNDKGEYSTVNVASCPINGTTDYRFE